MSARRLGVMYDRDLAPEGLATWARELDGHVDELWVVEDTGWAGGISQAAIALAATEHATVGLGIAPAPLRNPVLLAMEIATLARAHPGRFIAGIGHGVSFWMRDVGAMPRSQLALLEETIVVVRRLLRGEEVSLDGREVKIRTARLTHPPGTVPPVLAGVVKPKSLAVSGNVADGTILIEGSGPDSIARAPDHALVVYAYSYVGDDADRATAQTREDFAGFLGIAPGDVYIPSGSPADFAAQVEALWDAGAESVVLHPLGPDIADQTRRALDALGR